MSRRTDTAEHARLAEATGKAEDDLFDANPWYEWGPYLSERAWGTVREDYSDSGDAWGYFPHDHARSRAYRWNEDGMAGISDVHHDLCLALALWNGRDPILKERMFGLTGPQGNHGEDAKEYWWYLDALPSHALLRWRYHYPQAEFPYGRLVEENGRRGKDDPEFELLDTGVFEDSRYWGVEVTYAKASATDVLMRVSIENHGPDPARLHVLPSLWFRNTWRWHDDAPPGSLGLDGDAVAVAGHPRLAGYRLQAAAAPGGTTPTALFCDNETNLARLYGVDPATPFPKDGIGDHVVHGAASVNPAATGTKAAWWYPLDVPGGGRTELRLRLSRPEPARPDRAAWAGASFDEVVAARTAEADDFYDALGPDLDEDDRRILRQASAGLVWSKQMYPYRVESWLDGDPGEPPPPLGHRYGRNVGWRHLDSFDVLAMPDPWEYPWFAAWDLGFHAVAWAHLDPAFAKYQMLVLLREWFIHPNGAIPSYEWSFDDVNPPVQAMAAIRIFQIDGHQDVAFLKRAFHKLLLNFTWWLNRQDPDGNNVFGGGFLGLDNISPVDRSHLPPGVHIEQADGTAWMAYYSLAMLFIAVHLARHDDDVYEDMVVKFLEQFVLIVDAIGESGMFDATDGFFYDRITSPQGTEPIRVQTLVSAIPVITAAAIGLRDPARITRLNKRFARLADRRAGRADDVAARLRTVGDDHMMLLSIVSREQLATTLGAFFAEDGFLSPHGLRSISKRHEKPYEVPGVPGATISYEPAESRTNMYGGNSNWRGPVWLPVNYLVVRALAVYHQALGDDFTMDYPTGSGVEHTLAEVADDLTDRMLSIWRRGPTAAGRCSAGSRSCRATRPGATTCCSSSTSTATTAPASARPTRRAGPPWSSTCSSTAPAAPAPTAPSSARRASRRPGRRRSPGPRCGPGCRASPAARPPTGSGRCPPPATPGRCRTSRSTT